MNSADTGFGPVRLDVRNLRVDYGDRTIFSGISFEASGGEIVSVSGQNGSGKTTFLRSLVGLARPADGAVSIVVAGTQVKSRDIYRYVSFTGPYVPLYEEFSLDELARHLAGFRSIDFDSDRYMSLVRHFSLERHCDRPVRQYSSGMKQRAKLILATLPLCPVLIVDEPGTNLDEQGAEECYSLLRDRAASGGLVVVASNLARELKLGSRQVRIEDFK